MPIPRIPKIIHQTWKNESVPPEYRSWQATWRALNPAFEYRLWTDEQIDELVRTRFPELYDIFRSYRDPICRVDLGRYLILKAFGGVYTDLDCECLKPIDALLVGSTFVIGREPDEHVRLKKAVQNRMTEILCPSFIASVPDEPFWNHILKHIVANRDAADVLDATGPFMLSRALHSYDRRGNVVVLPASLLYPFTKDDCETGKVHDIEFWEPATRHAYNVHYWAGTWWKGPNAARHRLAQQVRVRVVTNGQPPAGPTAGAPGKISCLMVARGRPDLAERAVRAFAEQTYPDRELLVIIPTENGAYRNLVSMAPGVRLVKAPERVTSAGAVLLAGIAEAAGAYICLWEEGDLHDPQRLEYQHGFLAGAAANATFLKRPMLWQPGVGRLSVSDGRLWQETLLWERAALPPLSEADATEPAFIAQSLMSNARLASIDLPRLLVRLIHGPGGPNPDELRKMWERGRTHFEGQAYRRVLTELSKRLPLNDHPLTKLEVTGAPVADLFGHLSAPTGLGVASKSTLLALRAASISTRAYDLPLEPKQAVKPLNGTTDRRPDVTIVHTNPDALELRLRRPDALLSADKLLQDFSIGYWAWEAPGIPPSWEPVVPLMNEIWVPTSFVAKSVAADVPVPAVAIPHAVVPAEPVLGRPELGLSEQPFIFLFMFDSLSGLERKNPLGLIKAYRAAFPTDDGKTLLFLKGKALKDEEIKELQARAGGRNDIRIVNERYSSAQINGLLAACDCYVSLHRSEGFGLTIAEAMYFGKPVIATAYSGNLDFTFPDNSYLVPYRLYELDRQAGAFAAGTRWADPDLGRAAGTMRHVVANQEEARMVGRRGALWVRENLSYEAVGEMIKRRLLLLQRAGKLKRR